MIPVRKYAGSACFVVLCAWGPVAVGQDQKDPEGVYTNIEAFTRALQLIRQDYVDEKSVSYRELIQSAMRGMLSDLDPHSQFLDETAYRGMRDDARSEFGGLGVVVAVRDGALTVVTPMEDTPGFKAGLLPGDLILKIDGNPTERMELTKAVEQLRGAPGTKVTLTIMRPSTRVITDYELTRDVIKVESVKDARIIESGGHKIGYARLTQFSEPTADDLERKLRELEEQGMEALILDLRHNPGGLLTSAVEVCGLFVEPGQMVVYTEGRSASQRQVYRTPDTGWKRREYPVAILVNGGSASGAEIVAGALKDLGRAVVVGETTFGKGSVQSVIQLEDGTAIRLTTARYYTPGRQMIHEKGITPNIRATMSPTEERILLLMRREDFLLEEDPFPFRDFRDTQLDRAVDALKGTLIYGDRKPANLRVRR